MRSGRRGFACHLLLVCGTIAVLAAVFPELRSITFRQSLAILAFLVFFAAEYMRLTPRRLFIVISVALIAGIVLIALQVHETLVLSGRINILAAKFAAQIDNPLFNAWLVCLIVLVLRYLYLRIAGPRVSKAEGLLTVAAGLTAYSVSRTVELPVNIAGNTYALPVVNLLVCAMTVVYSIDILRNKQITFLDETLVVSQLASFVILLALVLFLFVALYPFHQGDAGYIKGISGSIIGITVFAVLLNAQVHVERNERILRAAFCVILGAALVVLWISEVHIQRFLPRFELFQ